VAGSYQGLTGKQALAVQRLSEWTEAGHKNIMFAQNPGTVALIAAELAKREIKSVVLHGGISIANLTAMLDEDFRYGDVPNLLTTFGVMQAGYNVGQANRVLLIDRDWRHKVEDQSIRRVLRPDQKRTVLVERLHHLGSIDVYQDQMVAFKRDSAQAGLDWAAPALDDVEFLHLDTILGRFVNDLAKLSGMSHNDVRQSIKRRKAIPTNEGQQLEVTFE